MGTFNVLDSVGGTQAVTNNPNGRGAAAASAPIALSTEDLAAVADISAVTQDVVDAINATGIPTVAHDAVDSGDPLKVGGRAVSSQTSLTNVAAADRTDALFTVDGAQLVRQIPLGDLLSARVTNTDGAEFDILAAQAAGIKLYLQWIVVCNSSATACTLDIKDGASGTVKLTVPVPATGGVVLNLGEAPIAFTAATKIVGDASAATTTITVSAGFRTSKI